MTTALAAIATFFTYPKDLLKHNDPSRQSTLWKLNIYDQNIASMVDQSEYLSNKPLRAERLSDFKNAKGCC